MGSTRDLAPNWCEKLDAPIGCVNVSPQHGAFENPAGSKKQARVGGSVSPQGKIRGSARDRCTGFGTETALACRSPNFLTNFQPGEIDGKDRRRRDENGERKRSQVCRLPFHRYAWQGAA